MNGKSGDGAEKGPKYLQAVFARLATDGETDTKIDINTDTDTDPSLEEIKRLPTRQLQNAGLLLARHLITRKLAEIDSGGCGGLCPDLILQRAAVYEALGCSELALADAYVSYTLCEVVLEGGDVSDLEPVTVEGENWPAACCTGDEAEIESERQKVALRHKYRSLILLARSALLLGCQHQAKIWIDELLSLEVEVEVGVSLEEEKRSSERAAVVLVAEESQRQSQRHPSDVVVSDFCDFWSVYDGEEGGSGGIGMFRSAVSEIRRNGEKRNLFGWSSRVVYPWNEHEPDRMSKESLDEINANLQKAAPDLEVEISVLPNLVPNTTTSSTQVKSADAGRDADTDTDERADKLSPSGPSAEGSSQLGLYAKKDLAPGTTILEERSVLTAIRPHGEALCDACAADMEAIPQELRRYCPGCNIPFCSEACYDLATKTYHAVNEEDEENDEGYPPYESPFCPGSSGNEDLHTLGRAESSTTPEWDLYFLLLSRTMQMAETRHVHPLDLFEVKYLWGDFSPAPPGLEAWLSGGKVKENENENRSVSVGGSGSGSGSTPRRTLPYSVRHHVELPLQWFEVLMHSRPECRPYSKHWLERYDWWIVQTLFAKFRGVADAQQSTWTGKPEVAAVHPLWCLANHSCNPNVTWKSSGVRDLTVVSERVWRRSRAEKEKEGQRGEDEREWKGIKAGEEIWNHYTDVHESDFRERRARLNAVLGGECRCERCSAAEALIMR